MSMKKGTLALATIAGLALVMACGPAEAKYRICNKSDSSVSAAFGYKQDGDWVSEGWWNIEPGKCATVYSKDLTEQYYYFYAESDDDSGNWSGKVNFCTIQKEFTIVGNTNCKGRGYGVKGFREVDVGDSSSWTSDLTE